MKNFENPAMKLIAGFLCIIIIGAVLLSLPFMRTETDYSFIDILFTSFSSVCVTGLSSLNIGTYFTIYGQIVILMLIQLGGLGYMTIAVLLLAIVKKRLSICQKLSTQASVGTLTMEDLKGFVRYVVFITFVIELVGAVLLTIFFHPVIKNQTIYYAIFHSVSAFCNSGFSLFSDSLYGFRNIPSVLITMGSLIVLGGLGFVVIYDLLMYKKLQKISYHSKFVLYSTLYLILIPAVLFFITEYNNSGTIAGLSIWDKIAVSFFHSVTARTAGFNVVEISKYLDFNLLFCMILMFIGASPAGTGGGIKTTTFVTILYSFIAMFKNHKDVSIFNRRIEDKIVDKSWVLFLSAIFIIFIFVLLLMLTESFSFKELFFEVISAFGTVGLSCGITSGLSNLGKIIIIMLMFIGRLGPLLIVSGFFINYKALNYKYPEEKIIIG